MVNNSSKIVVDSLEQAPLTFEGIETMTQRLDVGDYALMTEGVISNTRVERKSLSDLFSSFTHNYDAEKAKIARAKEAGYRYIIAIETSCSEVRLGCRYWCNGRMNEVEKPGISQVRQMMTLCHRYGIEVHYFSGRDDMAFWVKEYLLAELRKDK